MINYLKLPILVLMIFLFQGNTYKINSYSEDFDLLRKDTKTNVVEVTTKYAPEIFSKITLNVTAFNNLYDAFATMTQAQALPLFADKLNLLATSYQEIGAMINTITGFRDNQLIKLKSIQTSCIGKITQAENEINVLNSV